VTVRPLKPLVDALKSVYKKDPPLPPAPEVS
jgi:hypothetical protein